MGTAGTRVRSGAGGRCIGGKPHKLQEGLWGTMVHQEGTGASLLGLRSSKSMAEEYLPGGVAVGCEPSEGRNILSGAPAWGPPSP